MKEKTLNNICNLIFKKNAIDWDVVRLETHVKKRGLFNPDLVLERDEALIKQRKTNKRLRKQILKAAKQIKKGDLNE